MCIVGSGAGGGVIAGDARASGPEGRACVEAAGYFNESDFNQLELSAYENMYWRGGPHADGRLQRDASTPARASAAARSINWTNCLRTRPWVREQWAREHGLEGVDGPDFDRHLDAIFERLSVQRPLLGPERPAPAHEGGRGRSSAGRFQTILRNADDELLRPGVGRPTSASATSRARSSSTQQTYLQDAFDARRRHRRALHASSACWSRTAARPASRAPGRDPETGRTARVTVRAPQVVVAAGSLESPALLLRSQIGGPAVGNYLRIHPCTALFGIYGEDQEAWWGPPQAGLVDEFAAVEDGYGFLIETTQYAPGAGRLGAAVHRRAAAQGDDGEGALRRRPSSACCATTATAASRSTRTARPSPYYDLTDELDVRNTHRAIDAQARLHAAAGAREIQPLAAGTPRWRDGRRPRRVHRALAARAAARRAASGSSARTRWAPAAWAPTRRPASPTRGASCTTRRACGSATAARSRPPRAPTR